MSRATLAGVRLGARWSAVDAAGLYVPGGRAAYPSSLLMNVIPAKVSAGFNIRFNDTWTVETLEAGASDASQRYAAYGTLLEPLESIHQPRHSHPEGDVLYHSLQVYELVREQRPYDIDLQLAALLHDVGKGIDPADHVTAGLAVLEGLISERTAWLIGHHMQAQSILDGTIGARARRRLQQSDSYEELVLLARCDREGRVPGVEAPELDEAIKYLRELAQTCGE